MGDRGTYFAATGDLPGALTDQLLLSIENPDRSGVLVYVRRSRVQGVTAKVAMKPVSYTLARAEKFPTGGTAIRAALKSSFDLPPAAIVRALPDGIASPEAFASITAGVVTDVGAMTPPLHKLFEAFTDDDAIQLEPGEAAIVSAGTNLDSWDHFVDISWSESSL